MFLDFICFRDINTKNYVVIKVFSTLDKTKIGEEINYTASDFFSHLSLIENFSGLTVLYKLAHEFN